MAYERLLMPWEQGSEVMAFKRNRTLFDRQPWRLPFILNGGEFWDGSTNVTVAGQGVSSWGAVVGTHAFTQGTDTNRPTYANGILTFVRASSYWMRSGAFAVAQPFTMFGVINQTAWTTGSTIWDGAGINGGRLLQAGQGGTGATPSIQQYSGSYGAQDGTNCTIGAFHIVISVYNGASSTLQVDANTVQTGDPGATGISQVSLGASNDAVAPTAWDGQIKAFGYVKKVLSADEASQLRRALKNKYGTA